MGVVYATPCYNGRCGWPSSFVAGPVALTSVWRELGLPQDPKLLP
jgi:hypothetical protein